MSLQSSLETSVHKTCFQSVLNDKSHNKNGYQDSVVGILDFTKNTANHGNQHVQRLGENRMVCFGYAFQVCRIDNSNPHPFFFKVSYACSMQTLDDIERELTRLFPTRLTDLFEFLVASGTSMFFLSN